MIDKILGPNRVIATVTIDDVELAAPTAAALAKGGVHVVEVMLRTATGLDAITAIRSELPDVIVGAGTVLSVDALNKATEAGAAFAVSPGFDSHIATRAAELNMPYIPGAVTATEIQACLHHGITTIKFFPASTSGGPDALHALFAAFSFAGVKFIPTGGVDETNAFEYLALPAVRAVGMSWLASATNIRERAFDTITERSQLVSRRIRTSAN
jgi:2-dehydro-3-deoxyphosphogluconate aldolase / (4S)-4-hydroxy-2-oxoglutarate aldolase